MLEEMENEDSYFHLEEVHLLLGKNMHLEKNRNKGRFFWSVFKRRTFSNTTTGIWKKILNIKIFIPINFCRK